MKKLVFIFIAYGLCSVTISAQIAYSDIPIINARSAILIDANSGAVLFEKNPDIIIPPASLTKIMTLHVVYNAIEKGIITKDTIITIKESDCANALQYNSSIMGLRPGMKVKVITLMQGLAVLSANDAAFALARTISGSVELFALEMNKEAQTLGFNTMFFEEPSGLSSKNTITAREYAYFISKYIELHPLSLQEIHALKSLTFPLPENMPYNAKAYTATIPNRNLMLNTYSGCDGIKTGFINESGYNNAVTALRGTMRLICITLGGTETKNFSAGAIRVMDGKSILDYGFNHYITLYPEIKKISPIRVYCGEEYSFVPVPLKKMAITVQKELADTIVGKIEKPDYLFAPFKKNTSIGEIIFTSNTTIIARIPLGYNKDIPVSNIFFSISDSIQFRLREMLGFKHTVTAMP